MSDPGRLLLTPEPHAENTDGLREEIARRLCEQRNGVSGWDHEPGRRYWLEDADALLSGPLADAVQEAAEADKRLNALIAVRAERDALLAKLRAVEAEVVEEEAYRASDPAWEISVLVPTQAGDDLFERIFDAVADAAYEAQPEDRKGWDVFTSASKNPTSVPTHLLHRALDAES